MENKKTLNEMELVSNLIADSLRFYSNRIRWSLDENKKKDRCRRPDVFFHRKDRSFRTDNGKKKNKKF